VHICIFACHCASGGAIFFPFDSDSKGVFIIALPPLLPCLPLCKMQLVKYFIVAGYHNIRVCSCHENSE
jgi:hypothetical protein